MFTVMVLDHRKPDTPAHGFPERYATKGFALVAMEKLIRGAALALDAPMPPVSDNTSLVLRGRRVLEFIVTEDEQ